MLSSYVSQCGLLLGIFTLQEKIIWLNDFTLKIGSGDYVSVVLGIVYETQLESIINVHKVFEQERDFKDLGHNYYLCSCWTQKFGRKNPKQKQLIVVVHSGFS